MNGSVNGPGQSVLVLTLSICGGQSSWASNLGLASGKQQPAVATRATITDGCCCPW